MDINTYKVIRGHPNFLFRYYEKMGGILIEQQFNIMFPMWIEGTTGQNFIIGKRLILQNLDKKFGYINKTP